MRGSVRTFWESRGKRSDEKSFPTGSEDSAGEKYRRSLSVSLSSERLIILAPSACNVWSNLVGLANAGCGTFRNATFDIHTPNTGT